MTNVASCNEITGSIIGVGSSSILDKIEAQFDVYTRADTSGEVILDATCIEDDDERIATLCQILGESTGGEISSLISSGGFIVFYA